MIFDYFFHKARYLNNSIFFVNFDIIDVLWCKIQAEVALQNLFKLT